MHNRRAFLKLLSTIGGGSLLPAGIGAHIIQDHWNSIAIDKLSNDEAYWNLIRSQFRFADGVRYFNNASLGACPTAIRDATIEFRNILDDFPSKYMWGGWDDEVEHVRQQVADLFHVSAEEIALNHNTTEGMNIVARSFDLQAGDEIILADHEHASGRIPWEVWQKDNDINIVRPTLPILPESPAEIVDIYRKAITNKTKVISICHGVNTNGMVLPIKAIAAMAKDKGIFVAVDGAQTAGMFNIDLHDMGCDVYTASAHKWLFAPNSSPSWSPVDMMAEPSEGLKTTILEIFQKSSASGQR